MREWKEVEDRAQVLLYAEQNSKALLSLFRLLSNQPL